MKLGFVVRHYAGEVSYDGDGFVDKNKDRCPEDLLVLLRNSSRLNYPNPNPNPTPYTLHPTPYTLHPTPYT